jgi:rhodanese-related sulfurtransferase/rubrerythrin
MQSQDEASYALIDVRQPEEYEGGHIPGARLVPLSELMNHASELEGLSNRRLVFYCQRGMRSRRASSFAARALHLPSVFTLAGGFEAWEGPALGQLPRPVSVDLTSSVETLLRQALDLEKGVHRLYSHVASEYPSGILGETLATLIDIERTHGRDVYELLVHHAGVREEFEALFDALPGEIIEHGESFEAVSSTARELGKLGELALLELALEIELGAFDLYKSLAVSAASAEARQALSKLAQQEKQHAELVFAAIASTAKTGTTPRASRH